MTATSLTPQHFFAERFGIAKESLGRILGGVLGKAVDDGDIYFEYLVSEAISLEDGVVKKASKSITQGAGVRAIADSRTGYGYSDDITIENLALAAQTARAIASDTAKSGAVAVGQPQHTPHDLYPVQTFPTEVPLQTKIDLLLKIDQIARAYDPRISKVFASLASQQKIVLIATADGLVVGDILPLLRLSVSCIAEHGTNRQTGTHGGGGRFEFDFLLDEERYARYAREAARQAIVNLDAIDAPAGYLDVVLGPGWPGILLHEAVGHGLEGDFNRKKVSAFSGRIGEQVASPLVTVVDDGTLPGRRGSLNVDDEGTPTSRTTLIENGVLRGYLQDRLNARLMGLPLTGNGRRESYAHIPMPRMTNTFMLPGESDPEDIIRSVQHGLYAVNFGGGQVDITNGKFVFSASEAYLIENGKVTRPVKGATLIGNGPDVLTRVSMVGNDLRLDEGVGTCGKDGQSVPVGVGLPTIRVDGITVGGTQR
ncbi:MAG TPA: metalloprotease TldD [Alphaproteobacteria bacterium]|nr:metalloprotease TldD [Alphaproteobacteria bacterium]